MESMSPKQRVAVMTAIFAALGIGVSAGIIAAGGGFTGPIPNPPTQEDIWDVGRNIQDGTVLEYALDARGPSSSLVSASVSMSFEDAGDNWNVTLTIVNATAGTISETIPMSKKLTKEGSLDEDLREYFEPVQASVLAVRDMDYSGRPKYLVVGAPWDTIFVSSSSIVVRVTAQETVQTEAGMFDTSVLGYKLNDKTSRIWVAREMPLPVKAEVYDAEDNLQYRYELVKASGV